jgi:hypothetical protein
VSAVNRAIRAQQSADAPETELVGA